MPASSSGETFASTGMPVSMTSCRPVSRSSTNRPPWRSADMRPAAFTTDSMTSSYRAGPNQPLTPVLPRRSRARRNSGWKMIAATDEQRRHGVLDQVVDDREVQCLAEHYENKEEREHARAAASSRGCQS